MSVPAARKTLFRTTLIRAQASPPTAQLNLVAAKDFLTAAAAAAAHRLPSDVDVRNATERRRCTIPGHLGIGQMIACADELWARGRPGEL